MEKGEAGGSSGSTNFWQAEAGRQPAKPKASSFWPHRRALLTVRRWWHHPAFEPFLKKQMLFIWTVGCVITGGGLGLALRSHVSSEVITYLAFPGELMLRALMGLVLPVVSFSMLAGVLGLRHVNHSGHDIWRVEFSKTSIFISPSADNNFECRTPLCFAFPLQNCITRGSPSPVALTRSLDLQAILSSPPCLSVRLPHSPCASLPPLHHELISRRLAPGPVPVRLSQAIVRYLAFLWALMVLANGVALLLMHCLQPGAFIRPLESTQEGLSCPRAPGNSTAPPAPTPGGFAETSPVEAGHEPLLYFLRLVIPTNVVAAAAESQYIGVLAFVALVGLLLPSLGEKAEPVMEGIEVVHGVIIQIMYRVVWFIPLGTASLVAGTLLRACALAPLATAAALFCGALLAVLAAFGRLVVPAAFVLIGNVNVIRRAKCSLPALLTGFGTASSTATMAESIEGAIDGGCPPELARAVLSLASCLNRAGSTLYEVTTVLFIAQVHGMPLSGPGLLLISLLATFSPVASMPMGALLSSITALEVYGMQAYVPELAMILAVDWFVDRLRTMVNIWGDLCATICVDEWNKARNEGKVDLVNLTPSV